MTAYKAVLDELWTQAHAPRTTDAPTVVSTFAGAGGSSLGYHAAGFRELLAVEWDSHACACLRRNFPDVAVHEGDIAALDPDVLKPLLAEHGRDELDLLDGSPPCQGFSAANWNRQLDDPRNRLFQEFVRLLRAWQPRALVMENVPTIATGASRAVFLEILEELRAAGYVVRCAIMDSSAYGAATSRRRLIILGARADLGVTPTHPPATESAVVVVREAFADILDHGPMHKGLTGKLAVLAPLMPAGVNGGKTLGARGGKASFFGATRLHWQRPAPTILKSYFEGQGGLLHPGENRYLSARELCRAQSFPDQYDWSDSIYRQIYARIGNSVPPLLTRAIARHLRQTILA